MALEEERTDAHHVHGLREQLVRGRAVAAPGERLQPLDDLARERVRDDGGIDAEIQARNPIRLFLRARKRPDDVQQVFFGEADQRPAQQRAERERVAAIGQNAGQRDQILDSWRRNSPLPAWVATGMPRRSSASS
jgi:hypothetical protein